MMSDFYKMRGSRFIETEQSRLFDEFIQNENLGKFWTITRSGKIIGYAILTFGYSFEYGGRDASVNELYLKEEFRERGFESLILESVEFFARKHDVNAIHLEAGEENKRYLKAGFSHNNKSFLTKIPD